MSSVPDRVLIVDERLVPLDSFQQQQLHFIQLRHPRTQQEQSFAIDHQSKTLFELIQHARSHSSWFVNNQHVLPNGSLYMVTPINLIFLLLPKLWSIGREKFVAISTLVDESIKKLQFDETIFFDRLSPICDVNDDQNMVQLNEDKLMAWLRDRIDRLKTLVDNEEQAFDLICEYLPDEIVERCQQVLKLQGIVRYDLPIGQKPVPQTMTLVKTTTTTTTKKTVAVAKRSTLYLVEKRTSSLPKPRIELSTTDQDVSKTVVEHAKQVLFDHHLNSSQLSRFHEFHRIQNKSDCIFAKRARCWSAPDWLENVSIDDNCERLLPTFILFCAFVQEASIDGYVIEIPHNHLTETIEDFGRIFRQVLRFLSDHDPAKRHCMNVSPARIGQAGWVFEFDRITFFITTFTPHYSANHPRYAHGSNNYCHILFQPELSFLRHNLSDDTPDTNWTQPTTSRDKIRVAFRDHNREYPIRPTIFYPPAHDMIRPLSNDLEDIVEWWL